jgi:hypothetical protein
MVLRLAEVLAVPRADRNALLAAAGFASRFPQLALDAAEMEPVRAAMDWTIRRHEPYPAAVMDRLWRIVALNGPARMLFAPLGLSEGASLLEAVRADAPARFIENWGEVGHHMMTRLRMESARSGGIAELDSTAAHLARDPAVADRAAPDRPSPVLPTIYRAGDLRLSLFSTYAEFGTAEEIALAEMKIELMFPADEATASALCALSPDAH